MHAIGFITRWNATCGVSMHAELIGREFIRMGIDVKVFAPHIHSASRWWHHRIVREDEDFVTRCYEEIPPDGRGNGGIEKEKILREDFDYLIVESYSQLPKRHIERLISQMKEERKDLKVVAVIHEGKREDIQYDLRIFDAIVVFDERYVCELFGKWDSVGNHLYVIPSATEDAVSAVNAVNTVSAVNAVNTPNAVNISAGGAGDAGGANTANASIAVNAVNAVNVANAVNKADAASDASVASDASAAKERVPVEVIPYPCLPVRRRWSRKFGEGGRIRFFSFGRQPVEEYRDYIHALQNLSAEYDLIYHVVRSDGELPFNYDWIVQERRRLSNEELYEILWNSDIHLLPKSNTRYVVVSSTLCQCLGSLCITVVPDTRHFEMLPRIGVEKPVVMYEDAEDLELKLKALIKSEEYRENVRYAAMKYVEENRCDKIAKEFLQLFHRI